MLFQTDPLPDPALGSNSQEIVVSNGVLKKFHRTCMYAPSVHADVGLAWVQLPDAGSFA